MPNFDALNQLHIQTPKDYVYLLDLRTVMSTAHDHSSEITEHAVERGSNITDHVRPKADRVTMTVFVSECPIFDSRMEIKDFPFPLNAPQDKTRTLPLALPVNPGPSILTPGGLASAVGSLVDQIFSSPRSYAATLYDTPTPGSQTVTARLGGFSQEFDGVREAFDVLEGLRLTGALLKVLTPKRDYGNMVLEAISMSRNHEDGDGATLTLTFREVRIVDSKKTRAPASTVPAAKAAENKGAQEPKTKERKASWLSHTGPSSRGRDLTQ
jgi:hypothetical protein